MMRNRRAFPVTDDKTSDVSGKKPAGIDKRSDETVNGGAETSHVTASASPQVSAVLAALAAGAGSWSATGRQAGVSRQWAAVIGRRHGLAPARREARQATVCVRVRPDAVAALDARAAAWGVSRSEAARRILSAALSARPADVR